METARINRAMERIASAAGRIATSARADRPTREDADLANRHERMRKEAASALEELDQLLAALEP